MYSIVVNNVKSCFSFFLLNASHPRRTLSQNRGYAIEESVLRTPNLLRSPPPSRQFSEADVNALDEETQNREAREEANVWMYSGHEAKINR